MKTTDELEREIASLCAHLDAATHRLLHCIREFDESGGWNEQGALSCAHWLTWRVGLDPNTAREKVRVARALGTLPAIDAALREGRLSYSKVRALTRVATPKTEEVLLRMALLATGAQLERLCRGYRSVVERGQAPRKEERMVQRRVMDGGMVKLVLVLEPDEAELIMRAVDRAREVRTEGREAADVSAETRWPSRADGMVRVAEAFLASAPVAGSGGDRFQVMVHLEQEMLGEPGDLAGTLEDGTRVSAETLRRVACDCGLVAVSRDGEALDVGRRTRSIPPAVRRALMLRDRGCAFPGCTHARYLHAHHVTHWLHGGATSVGNLVMLCSFHHHLVHEGRWTVTAAEDGAFQFGSPAGRSLAAEPAREPADDAPQWLRDWAAREGLDLGPWVNVPRWDGKHPDYCLAVEGILAAG